MKAVPWKRYTLGALVVTVLMTLVATSGLAQRGAGAGAGVAGQGRGAAAAPASDEVNPYNIDPKKGPVDLGLTDPALIGAIDVHAHLEPTVPRSADEGGLSIDYIDFAKIARLRGMRGFVQKSHSDMSSAVNAYMLRKHIAPDLEVFGRMTMNFATGGVNLASVVHFASIKGGWGRVIEMPTWDAEFRNVPPPAGRGSGEENRPWMALMPPSAPKFVSISRNGELLPEVKQLLEVLPKIRTADSNGRLALATGHSSGLEDLLLAREARRLGLQIVSPHGLQDMNTEQLQEYTKLGGFVEMRNTAGSPRNAKQSADTVRKVGAGSIIVASDCGFMNYPLHSDCMALIAQALRSQGISEQDLDIMLKENPAKFLSLPIKRTVPLPVPTSASSR